MNKVVKIIGVIAIVIIVPKTIMKVMGPKQPTPNSEIAFFVKETNAQLPKSIGPGVILSKVESDGKVVRYFYVLSEASGFVPSQKDKYEANLLSIACGPAKVILKHGATIAYHTQYSGSSSGEGSFETLVKLSQCP
jgi:hypothetical protein